MYRPSGGRDGDSMQSTTSACCNGAALNFVDSGLWIGVVQLFRDGHARNESMPLKALLQLQTLAILWRATTITQQRHIKRQCGFGGVASGDTSFHILLGA